MIDQLRRLRELDRLLASEPGLHIESFARAQQVSGRTITRDLSLLAELGHPSHVVIEYAGTRPVRYTHHYLPGVGPLFAR